MTENDDWSVQAEAKLDAMLLPFATGYYLLCQFHCEEALGSLNQIGESQMRTGWVFAMKGRCFFELHEYSRVNSIALFFSILLEFIYSSN